MDKVMTSTLLEDVVELEILPRLPVKSLLRLMCVCKNWKTLISSHLFRKLHREIHASSPPLLISFYKVRYAAEEQYTYLVSFDLDGKMMEKITLPIPLNDYNMLNLPYQSKLLCFVNYNYKMFYFYNPSTRQPFLLTNPSCFSSPEFKKCYSTGYGYNPSKDEYIMVHLFKTNDKVSCEVLNNISISNDNFKLHYKQWRSIKITAMLKFVRGPCVFAGGAFYWEAISDKNSNDEIILSFEVETDSFSTFGYPQDFLSPQHTSLLDLDDELYLVNYPDSPPTLVLWKLSPDNKLWTRYWEFDFKRLFGFESRSNLLDWQKYFRWDVFIYNLKYLKGYDHQPQDHEVSFEMGKLLMGDWYEYYQRPAETELKNFMKWYCYRFFSWAVESHTNLFTL